MSEAALRVPLRLWRGVLVLGPVAVVAVAFGSLWTLNEATGQRDASELSGEANRIAQLVDAYITRVIRVTSLLANAPGVADLAEAKTAHPDTDASIKARWTARINAPDDPFGSIRKLPESHYFADLIATGGAFREIFLTDKGGQLVAASNRPETFLQKDERWWKAAFAKASVKCRRFPLECVYIPKTGWDPSAGVYGYSVALPVVTADGRAVGVLKAVVDPGEVAALLNFAAFNRDLDVALIDEKGEEVFSSKPFFDRKVDLGGLEPGFERFLKLNDGSRDERQEERLACVRRLSSPVEGSWIIAVKNMAPEGDRLWKKYVIWCLFTVFVFLIAAGAFAVRIPAV